MANNKMTNPSWSDYASGNYEYVTTNPGYATGYGLGWLAFGSSVALLAAAAACPAMIPFAFAQSSFMIKTMVLTAGAATLAGSGYYVLPQIAKPFQVTHARNKFGELNLGEKITHSVLLGAVATTSVGFVAALFLAPAMLPFGLAAVAAYSMWLQAGIAVAAAATATVSSVTIYGLWKDKTSARAQREKEELSVELNSGSAAHNEDNIEGDEEKQSSCFGSFGCGK